MDSREKRTVHDSLVKNEFSEGNINPQNNEETIKSRLMDKYNMSSQEANDIMEIIVKKNNEKIVNENLQKNTINKEVQNSVGFENGVNINFPSQSENILKQNNLENSHNNLKTENSRNNDLNNEFNNNQQYFVSKNSNKTQVDVDNLISNIIPSYNQEVSIEVKDVNLTFDIITDKIDTLKEVFIQGLRRNKSKKVKLHALKDVNFKIFKGEKVGIIGYNGAGKSTLLNVITGIYPPDTGKVITYGKISPLLSLGAGFDFNYSGRKNIYLNGAVLGYDKKLLKEKEKEIIEFSELEEFIDIPIKNYSSGMLAKLGFSIATIVEPDILIIDEILGVGDVAFQKKSNDKMKSLMDGRTTVILVSHSISQIRNLCDKAIWIDQGSIRDIGEVNQVCDDYLKDSENASREQIKNIKFK